MSDELLQEIKQGLKDSLLKYLRSYKYKNTQPLDLLIPRERKVRSVVGGLETSMGTTVWEPIARALAKSNGFEVVGEKILKPDPMPSELASELSTLISLRENRATWLDSSECVERLASVVQSLDRRNVGYIKPPAGTGVDVLLRKGGRLYAFDIKTVQPNLGGIKSFNKQLLEWYAYSIFKDPDVSINCFIAYPYNPHPKDFWSYTPHTSGILKPGVDALVEAEFWDYISGIKDAYKIIVNILIELNLEGFGKELSEIIESLNTSVENVV